MIIEDFLIEDSEILNIQEKNILKNIIYRIPFFYNHVSTTKKFPYYSHTLISRPKLDENFNSNTNIKVLSEHFYFFYNFVKKFCSKHQIQYSNIIRSNINSTYYIPDYPYVDPHIDFSKPHIVILMYLNDVSKSSSTLVFNKTQNFDNKNSVLDVDKFENRFIPIKKEIYPEFGKIVAFDGKYYHSNKLPKPGENRIVCVFNLLI